MSIMLDQMQHDSKMSLTYYLLYKTIV